MTKLLVAVLAALLICAGCGGAAGGVDGGGVDSPKTGQSGDRLPDATLPALRSDGEPVDLGTLKGPAVRELLRAGTRGRAGVVVLFTGLSGSGKSTIARTLQDRLLDRTDRTVTLLDGDVVRQMLSSELSFSREHRVLNVRRIGFVASTIAAHGGIALCSPIAPYESTRCEVRAMVEQAGGGFVLVHVATPLEVCESRDRKGLYARARAGTVREFTGISDPYETPYRPDLTVDTSSQDVDEAVDRILACVANRGWVRLDGAPDADGRASRRKRRRARRRGGRRPDDPSTRRRHRSPPAASPTRTG